MSITVQYILLLFQQKSSHRYLTLLLLLVATPWRNVAWKGSRSSCAKGLSQPSNNGSLQQCSISDVEHRIGATWHYMASFISTCSQVWSMYGWSAETWFFLHFFREGRQHPNSRSHLFEVVDKERTFWKQGWQGWPESAEVASVEPSVSFVSQLFLLISRSNVFCFPMSKSCMTREIRRLPTKVQHLGEGSAFVALIILFHWPTSLHPKDVSSFSSS